MCPYVCPYYGTAINISPAYKKRFLNGFCSKSLFHSTTLPSLLIARTLGRVDLASLATVPLHVILSDPSVRFQVDVPSELTETLSSKHNSILEEQLYPRKTTLSSQSTLYLCLSSSSSLIFFLPLSPQIHKTELLASTTALHSTQDSIDTTLAATRATHYSHSTCYYHSTCHFHITSYYHSTRCYQTPPTITTLP